MYVIDDVAYAGSCRPGIKVASARIMGDLVMLVKFSTGETRLFDASGLLGFPAFESLRDPAVFRAFSIDHGVLCWCGGDVDVAPETVYAESLEYPVRSELVSEIEQGFCDAATRGVVSAAGALAQI